MKPHMYLLNKDWEPTIVYLDEMKEGREADYKTLSGWSLTGEPEEEKIVEVDPSLEKAHEDYKSIFGKNVPVNKKNDIERIQEKINETLTPVE
jgi:hypothetical protein